MSSCPGCGKKLRPLDLGQRCPHCGINMRFHGFEEQFYRDAKNAELSIACVSVKLRRFKVAFVGSRLSIARLCVMLLPLVSMLLPIAKAVVHLPFCEKSVSVSALGLYQIFSDGTLDFLMKMCDAELGGELFVSLRNVSLAVAGASASAVAVLLLTLLCFLSLKKMPIAICAASVVGTIFTVLSAVLGRAFSAVTEKSQLGMLSGNLTFAFIAAIVAFAAVFVVNFLIIKKGLPVEYNEGDLERVEIAHKVKRGEINIDDLPQPIVETAETRKIDEEIRREQEQFEKSDERQGATV